LQYTNGSPCGGSKKRSPKRWDDDDDDDDDDDKKGDSGSSGSRQKSAIISFHCDKDPLSTTTSATFVGVDPDECAYTFEVLSKDACTTAEPAKQGVGPAAVFAIIGVIAILVYFLGGVFYQRNVAHARGWRQLPNYSFWAGIGSFIKVSGQNCLQRSTQMVFPRVASVRDGILPSMEIKPSRRRSFMSKSRSSWEDAHLS
jgi:cation-dependent mannose-6-phosphate receptor